MQQPIPVSLLLFDGCDLLDVGGPYEVLVTANRVVEAGGGSPPFSVRTVSVDGGSVTAYGGLRLTPDGVVSPGRGVFLVPGAIDLAPVIADAAVMAAVRDCGRAAELIASVCTGSLLLAEGGLLGDVDATTHHEDLPLLAASIGTERAHGGVRWVDAGRVITGGGLSSGIAMALHLVARLVDLQTAGSVAAKLEYDWEPEGGLTVAAT